MSQIQMRVKEMQQEAQTTRKMLERVPNDKYDWQPHPKSMTVRELTTPIAELPSWVTMVLTTDGLDFAANPYSPRNSTTTAGLLDLFEPSLADNKLSLNQATEEQPEPMWTLSNGDEIYGIDKACPDLEAEHALSM